jgi:hypothetical protein
MNTNKKDNFNIEPLVFEIENVVKNGLNKILNEYIHRYELLENTHQQIMRLPSVLNELNINHNSYSEREIKDRCESFKKCNISPEFSIINNKISIIEQKYESVSDILFKILNKLEALNDDVKMIKETKTVETKLVVSDQTQQLSSTLTVLKCKSSIVSACENENIKFEINDSDDSSCDECEVNNSKDDKEVEVVDEEEEVDKEVVDEEEVVDEDEEVDKEVVDEEEVVDEDEEVVDEEEEVVDEEVVDEEEEKNELNEEQKLLLLKFNTPRPLCSECDCRVMSDEYITVVDGKNYCGGCKPKDDDVETEESESDEEEESDKEESDKEEEEEEELSEIEIDDITYCTNDEENGFIYELTKDGDVGEKVGYLKEGEPFFYADEK